MSVPYSATALARSAPGWIALLAILPALLPAQTWDGGGSNNHWSTSANWNPDGPPANNGGAAITFAGTVDPTPVLNQNWSIRSLAFAAGADAFTLSASGGSTLTLGSGGLLNQSAQLQTITHSLFLGASQTWNSSAGDLLVSGDLSSNWITLTKSGAGTLTLSGDNSGLRGPVAVSAGSLHLASNSALGDLTYGNTVASGAGLALLGGVTLTEGDLIIAGSGVSGTGALRNLSGANTLAADLKLSAAATVASDAGTLTLDKPVNTQGRALTLDGAGDIVVARNINGDGALTLAGSGARSLNGPQVNVSALTISGSGAVSSVSQLNLGGGDLVLAGSGTTTLAGSALNVGDIVVSGDGDTTFATQINASGGSFTQSGAGTTTFAGPGTNYFDSVNITGGEIVLDHADGFALQAGSGNVHISGATVRFERDDQVANWHDVTLGDGAVLEFGDTTQNIDQLVITGDSILDFGDGGSTLDVNSLSLLGDSVLTIVNWRSDLDRFFANVDPGSSTLAKIIFDGLGEAAWQPGSGGGSLVPVPEPAAYGLLSLGALLLFPRLRRRSVRRRASPS